MAFLAQCTQKIYIQLPSFGLVVEDVINLIPKSVQKDDTTDGGNMLRNTEKT